MAYHVPVTQYHLDNLFKINKIFAIVLECFVILQALFRGPAKKQQAPEKGPAAFSTPEKAAGPFSGVH